MAVDLAPTEAPVTVNGTLIDERAIGREMQYHPAPSPREARTAAAQALVVRELLLNAAAELGITEPDPPARDDPGPSETREEGLIRTVLAREVRTPEPDAEVCRRYYDNNRQRFRTPDMYESAHILIMANPDDEEAMATARSRAETVLARLREAPETFEALAVEFSDCPSASEGGHLGRVARGRMVPEFETMVFNLEQGQICPVPIRSRFGYHVARLDRREDGRQIPFEAAYQKIAQYLGERVWRRAVAQYVSLLIGQAEISGLEMAGAKSPLVQ